MDLKKTFAKSLRNPVVRAVGIVSLAIPGGIALQGEVAHPFEVEAVERTAQTDAYKADMLDLRKKARPIANLQKRIDHWEYNASENEAKIRRAKSQLSSLMPDYIAKSQRLNTLLMLDPNINESEYRQFAEVYARSGVETNHKYVPKVSYANSINEVRVQYQDNIAASRWVKGEMMTDAAAANNISGNATLPISLAGGAMFWLLLGGLGKSQTIRRWAYQERPQKHFH